MANLTELYISRPRLTNTGSIMVTGVYQGANTYSAGECPVVGDVITTFSAAYAKHSTLYALPAALDVKVHDHHRVGVARAVVTWEGDRLFTA